MSTATIDATAKLERLAAANAVCKLFIPETHLEIRRGVWVVWTDFRGKEYAKPWATRGQDFYPVWSDKWGHGGTCCTALSQLVRFVQGKPVLPLSTWAYWCSETIGLGRHRISEMGDTREALLATLRAGGYPEVTTCVFCGKSPIGMFDWYSIGGISGPGCYYGQGCKARKEMATP